jgi:hypothetical protein
VDIVQAVGRAIRRAEDKTVGTIVIPVLVDANADAERALESGEFKQVWDVVKAMRAHDEVLADELDELRRGLGRRPTSGGRPSKIRLDVPVGIGDAFARAFDSRLVEATTPNWEFWYGLLERFATREGSTRVPARHDEDGYPLGRWVSTRRTFYREHRLAPHRIARLEALSGWTWDAQEAKWEEGFLSLKQYVAGEGHARVPFGHVEDGYALGHWVNHVRTFCRAGSLATDRIAPRCTRTLRRTRGSRTRPIRP